MRYDNKQQRKNESHKGQYEFETYSRAFSLKRTMQELETKWLLVMLVKSQVSHKWLIFVKIYLVWENLDWWVLTCRCFLQALGNWVNVTKGLTFPFFCAIRETKLAPASHTDWQPTCFLQRLKYQDHQCKAKFKDQRKNLPMILGSAWPSSTASDPIFSTSILFVFTLQS